MMTMLRYPRTIGLRSHPSQTRGGKPDEESILIAVGLMVATWGCPPSAGTSPLKQQRMKGLQTLRQSGMSGDGPQAVFEFPVSAAETAEAKKAATASTGKPCGKFLHRPRTKVCQQIAGRWAGPPYNSLNKGKKTAAPNNKKWPKRHDPQWQD